MGLHPYKIMKYPHSFLLSIGVPASLSSLFSLPFLLIPQDLDLMVLKKYI